jgi:cellulose biosynthesis protein BcsQ
VRVYALFQVKGGVGKTASAVNLAWLAARDGLRTLLWDLDPQGAATFHFRIEPGLGVDVGRLARGEAGLERSIRGSDFRGLDVIPADPAANELAGSGRSESGRPLSDLLAPLEPEYDCLFLDCASGFTPLSDPVFGVADALLVPTIPTPLSLRTLAQLMKRVKRRTLRPLAFPFFSLVDRRKSLHRTTCDWVEREELGFLRARIPYSALVEEMAARRAPLFAFAPWSVPALAYSQLWKEIAERPAASERDSFSYSRSTRESVERAVRIGSVERAGRPNGSVNGGPS